MSPHTLLCHRCGDALDRGHDDCCVICNGRVCRRHQYECCLRERAFVQLLGHTYGLLLTPEREVLRPLAEAVAERGLCTITTSPREIVTLRAKHFVLFKARGGDTIVSLTEAGFALLATEQDDTDESEAA